MTMSKHSLLLRFGLLFAVVLICDLIPSRVSAQSPDATFQSLTDRWWEDRLQRNPLFATSTGDHRFDDRLPDVSVAAAESEQAQLSAFRDELATVDPDDLSPANQINYRIVQRVLDDALAELKFQSYLVPITNREGFHISFPELRNQMPFHTANEYRNYVARLRAFDRYAEDHIQLMKAGIQAGMTLPSAVLGRYREPIEAHITDDPARSLMYEPLQEMPPTISAEMQDELRRDARAAIADSVVPGYRRFLEFMSQEYVPSARGSIAASALPQGRRYYEHRVRHFTTLDLTPEQVHQTGMAEVERIRGEMRQIMRQVEFSGDIRAFADSLRDDERFYSKSPDDLMKEAALILKRMDGRLPELFGKLPRTPYGLKPIPDYLAPQTTTAYYQPPPGDLSRGGFYYLNTYDLKSRPLYGLEALSLHEAVPGHHLQLALQVELSDMPAYRRFGDFTVFIEGWALYAERLGLDVDFYEDPYSNFGRLTYEMWRACRLVVDTGIHYFGWSRQQAIDFMADNTALSLHNIRAEVDRYIAWPGQALAYKTGELRIRQLRREAEQALGDRFDVRQFHDRILAMGSVPLDVLTDQIRKWIEGQQATQ